MTAISTVVLLLISNIFMTFAWYGHLKNHQAKPLILVVLISWGIAFFEYCFQIPANRIGFSIFTLPQLKILQEVITLCVFIAFAIFYMGTKPSWNFLWASFCLVGAVYFIFRDGI